MDKIYVSSDVDRVLNEAERQAEHMKDEYVSVEHLMLSLIENPNSDLKEIFRVFGVDKNKFMEALATVRGSARVTSDNPEETYDALKKYGSDLVEQARNHKLTSVSAGMRRSAM